MKKFILPVLGLVSLFAITSCNSKDSGDDIKLSLEEVQTYVDETYKNAVGSATNIRESVYDLLSSKGTIKYTFSVDSDFQEPRNFWIQVGTYSSTIDFKNLTVSEHTDMKLNRNGEIKQSNEKFTIKFENNKFAFRANDKSTEFDLATSQFSKEEIFEDIVTKNGKTDVFKTWHSNAASFLFQQYGLAVEQMHNISIGFDTVYADFSKAKLTKTDNVVTIKCIGKDSLPEGYIADTEFGIEDKVLTTYKVNQVEGQSGHTKLSFKLEF